MSVRAATLLAVALLPLAACATLPGGLPGGPRGDHERRSALPPDVATALLAAALRQQFPFADPLPCTAGAPASRTGAGFTIVFEQNADGAWLPVADHRLRIVARSNTPNVGVDVEPLDRRHRLHSLGSAAVREIVIEVLPVAGTDTGCRVVASLPATVHDVVVAVVDRTLALARDDSAPLIGLSEPNLRTFVRHRLLFAAHEHLRAAEPRLAAERLHLANRVVDGDPAPQRALAAMAQRSGDVEFAREQMVQAVLVTADPTTRAALATGLATLRDPSVNPLGGSVGDESIAGNGGRGGGDAAELRVHTARRAHSEPVRDYGRLGAVHAQRRDDMGELACVLLAREHGPDTVLFADGNGDRLRRKPFDLATRVQRDRLTYAEPLAAPPAARDAVAAPIR